MKRGLGYWVSFNPPPPRRAEDTGAYYLAAAGLEVSIRLRPEGRRIRAAPEAAQ